MKIILVLIVTVFFIFLIKSNFFENFSEECPESCRNKIDETRSLLNSQSINNNTISLQELSVQVSNLSKRLDDNEKKVDKSYEKIDEVQKTIEDVKANLTK